MKYLVKTMKCRFSVTAQNIKKNKIINKIKVKRDE